MRTINTYTIKLKRMKKKNCGCWLPSYAAASWWPLVPTTTTPQLRSRQRWRKHWRASGSVITNQNTIDWLSSHTGPVGIIYLDFAGMDKSPDYSSTKLYNTVGMKLVDAVIKQNWKWRQAPFFGSRLPEATNAKKAELQQPRLPNNPKLFTLLANKPNV